jgi:hypothetical protein
MKKIILLFAAVICFNLIEAQTFAGIDIVKLNKALSANKVNGYKFDSVTEYNGIIGSYKDINGDELVICFDSLKRFQQVAADKKGRITKFRNGKTDLLYFENDYVMTLYIELPAFNVTMSRTSGFLTRAALEKIYQEINPEDLLKSALVKK